MVYWFHRRISLLGEHAYTFKIFLINILRTFWHRIASARTHNTLKKSLPEDISISVQGQT